MEAIKFRGLKGREIRVNLNANEFRKREGGNTSLAFKLTFPDHK